MKQSITFLLMFLLAMTTLHAQKLSIGGQLDLNFSALKGDGFSGKLKSGFNAGVFALFKISPRLNVEPAVEFSQRNVNTSNFTRYYSNAKASADNKVVTLSYAGLPVLVSYKLNSIITLKAGPQYSYLLNVSRHLMKNNKESFKKNDLGLLTAVSINPSDRIQVSLKYYRGIMDLNNVVTYRYWYNQQFSFGVSYIAFKK